MFVNIEDLLLDYVDDLAPVVHRLIEFSLCSSVYGGRRVYELTHKHDPYWDCSGELVDTGIIVDENSEVTLKDVSFMYTGCSLATYISGMGLSYETIIDDCERDVSSFLADFTKYFLIYCRDYKLFVDYFTEISNDDDLYDFAVELACDELELHPKIYPSEVLAGVIGQQFICDVYSKYKVYFDAYTGDIADYDELDKCIKDKYTKLANSYIIPQKFRRKICNTLEDKEIRQELESTYSEKELAVLFGNYKLSGSNSYAGHYTVKYQDILHKEVGKCPQIENYLPDISVENIKRIIESKGIFKRSIVDENNIS